MTSEIPLYSRVQAILTGRRRSGIGASQKRGEPLVIGVHQRRDPVITFNSNDTSATFWKFRNQWRLLVTQEERLSHGNHHSAPFLDTVMIGQVGPLGGHGVWSDCLLPQSLLWRPYSERGQLSLLSYQLNWPGDELPRVRQRAR
jgi:hypothetical protein